MFADILDVLGALVEAQQVASLPLTLGDLASPLEVREAGARVTTNVFVPGHGFGVV